MRRSVSLLGVAIPALAAAQEAANVPVAHVSPPPIPIIVPPERPATAPREDTGDVGGDAKPVPCPPATADRTRQDGKTGSGFVHEAGAAASTQGGAILGGAVAGPLGAAVGGVVVDHVGRAGRAVKNFIFGKGRRARKPMDASAYQDCEQEPPAADGND